MNNLKVSVIIPVYNCAEYIGTTLESVISQDFDDYEIIVIDDGSTDSSLEIINETLMDCKVPYNVIHQENAGVSVARNRGIDASNGQYLVFVDADDYVLKNHLSELYNPDYDFSSVLFAKKEGDSVSLPNGFGHDEISTVDFIKKELNMEIVFNFFQMSYNADIIRNNVRFTPGIVYGEDTEFALKALSYSDKIHLSDEVTYYYVQRDDSAIKTTEFRRFDIVDIFEKLAGFYKKQSKDDLADLIVHSRIPKAIFGNMNYFFFSGYDFEDVMEVMNEKDLFSKLKKYNGNDKKFRLKLRLFLLNPKLYYKIWFRFKNSID